MNLVLVLRLLWRVERRRLLRSLSDGSHPSSSQEHGSEPSVPPALPLLQHHCFGQPPAVSAPSCCPISSAPRSPSAARALWQRVPPSSRVSGTNVTKLRYGKKEAGTGEHLRHFNNKINKHKWKAAAPHGRLPHTKHKLKFQAWSSLLFHCRHSSFNPSEAPPWDSRPVSGAGVVHYQLLHRPRSVPTALGPAPLVTITIWDYHWNF